MGEEPRITLPVLEVLRALLEEPSAPSYGLELSQAAGRKSGTIYPVLARLERSGWLASEWEQVDPTEAGRPRRRLYHLTGQGELAARRAVAQHIERTPHRAPGLPDRGRGRPKEAPA